MNGLAVRSALTGDAAGINAVYNPFIKNSPVTFETQEYSSAERQRWLAERTATGRHPVFVATSNDGAVRGFASAAPFDPRGAYETSVKTSVFVTPECCGRA